jgi:hypothetical protein
MAISHGLQVFKSTGELSFSSIFSPARYLSASVHTTFEDTEQFSLASYVEPTIPGQPPQSGFSSSDLFYYNLPVNLYKTGWALTGIQTSTTGGEINVKGRLTKSPSSSIINGVETFEFTSTLYILVGVF